MKLQDKHCICKEWEEKFREAFKNRGGEDKPEVMQAQKRGKLCPFCGKKLIYKKRKGFIVVQFPPSIIDSPDPDHSDPTYFVSLEELGRMLKESK